ncbi:MAG: prepilin-type N-terminal cleavage/methylation domain-containing protein [Lysobacterales bacterium]|jgi:prepilin-type N-terminal cleavage/methylation domain-containing protein
MNKSNGFTLVESLVTTLLLGILFTGGSAVMLSGQSAWSETNTQIDLKEKVRFSLLRISKELRESGTDENDVLQVTITNGTGPGNSDIIRFSIPLCVCSSVMNSDGDIANWGAPLKWGVTGCSRNYTLESNGKVAICHFPPGNPSNVQNKTVTVSALNAHLANHGDLIGACTPCTVATNKYIEYRINNNNQLLRRVLTSTYTIVQEDIVTSNISDIKATLSGDQNYITVLIEASGTTTKNRSIEIIKDIDVSLRNK